MSATRSVVVIGAGVVGLSAAYYARQRGFDVTVVEREAAERATTSFGNSGLIVPSHFVPLAAPGVVAQGLRWMLDPESPFFVRPTLEPALWSWGYRFWRASTRARAERAGPLLRDLNLAGRARFRELSETLEHPFDLHQHGLLMLCHSELGLASESATAARARALGIPAEVLDRAGVEALQPGVDLNVVGGVHYPEDAQLDPGRFMAALQSRLVADGVRFLWQTEVTGLRTSGRRIDALLLAPAGWSASPDHDTLGPTARAATPPPSSAAGEAGSHGGEAPAQAFAHAPASAAGDAAVGAAPAPAPPVTPTPTELACDELVLAAGVWSEGLAAAVGVRLPMRAGKGYSLTVPNPAQALSVPVILSEAHVAVTPLVGATRFGGTMEVTAAPRDGRAAPPSEGRVRGIVRSVGRYFPVFSPATFEGVPVWHGYRPTSPDGLPYLGRSAAHDNLVVASGHAMMGLSLGPVSGALTAEILAGEAPSIDLEAMRPDRFSR